MQKDTPEGNENNADWSVFDNWSELFDAVCISNGHIGNSDLAFQVCEKTGRSGQRDIETMSRNVANWRGGINLPSKSNLRALTEVLNISKDKDLKRQWLALYAEAKGVKPVNISVTGTKIESKNTFIFLSSQKRKPIVILLAAFSAIVIGAFLFINWLNNDSIDIDELAKNEIVWRRNVSMHVGEKISIHGQRGLCGEMPPSAEYIRKKFPVGLTSGKLDVGNFGTRYSRRCGGVTPAIEITYEATSEGTDSFKLYRDPINITVYPVE